MTLHEDGPSQVLIDDLNQLIDRWKDKPPDDSVSTLEVLGALAAVALQHALNSRLVADEDDGESVQY